MQASVEELGVLRSIRVVIGETVSDKCLKTVADGYLEVSDLVSQMISVHKFDMSKE